MLLKKNDYIMVKLQDGPIKEVGVNGCQIDEVVEFCRDTIQEFNTKEDGKFACQENAEAIDYLTEAVLVLKRRTARREAEGAEGTSRATASEGTYTNGDPSVEVPPPNAQD